MHNYWETSDCISDRCHRHPFYNASTSGQWYPVRQRSRTTKFITADTAWLTREIFVSSKSHCSSMLGITVLYKTKWRTRKIVQWLSPKQNNVHVTPINCSHVLSNKASVLPIKIVSIERQCSMINQFILPIYQWYNMCDQIPIRLCPKHD